MEVTENSLEETKEIIEFDEEIRPYGHVTREKKAKNNKKDRQNYKHLSSETSIIQFTLNNSLNDQGEEQVL